MDLFWMGLVVAVVLIYSVAGMVLIRLWHRAGIRKMEEALTQLQNELVRINSLLEETSRRILGAGTALENRTADDSNAKKLEKLVSG